MPFATELISFEGIQEGDETDQKEEMWFPSEKNVNGAWPVQKPLTDDFWQSLKSGSDLSPQHKEQSIALLRQYPEVFPDEDGKLDCTMGVHRIETGNHLPVKQRLRKFSH